MQTIDLSAYGANDCLSAGVWRTVDLAEGYFQLFRDITCEGPFNTFFLDEWNVDVPVPLSGWWINKQSSSIYYENLTPPQYVELFTSADGSSSPTRPLKRAARP